MGAKTIRRAALCIGAVNILLAAVIIGLHHEPNPTRTSTSAAPTDTDVSMTTTSSSFTLSEDSTTTAGPVDSSTTSEVTSPRTDPPTTAPTTTEAPTTTLSGPECRNSHDPTCGPFHWAPAPLPNTPFTVEISVDPPQPHAGDNVTFHVVVHDGESRIAATNPRYGDGCCLPRSDGPGYAAIGYGPWDPPLRPTTSTQDFRHVYTSAGTFTFHIQVLTWSYYVGEDCPGDPAQPMLSHYTCADPYYSYDGEGTTTITVSP